VVHGGLLRGTETRGDAGMRRDLPGFCPSVELHENAADRSRTRRPGRQAEPGTLAIFADGAVARTAAVTSR